VSSKTTSRTAASAGKKAAIRRPPPRYVQQQPTPERYREIQQALSDRGYFHGTVDGTWGADSMDALKRFQMDQNVDADGKISALSLIALGLGPKRENAAVRSAPSSVGEPTTESTPPAPNAVP
jgi:peptidoglycan hydrolase-like protein with peptidoglycan-binding domain